MGVTFVARHLLKIKVRVVVSKDGNAVGLTSVNRRLMALYLVKKAYIMLISLTVCAVPYHLSAGVIT